MSFSKTRTKTKDRVLEDVVREDVVDQYLSRRRRRIGWLALIVVVLLVAWLVWWFTRDSPVEYSSAEDHFKYGSIGSSLPSSKTKPREA